jgi:hypothetical protein
MLALVATLLAVTPAPGQASLLAPQVEEARPTASLLVAQAGESAREARIRELSREVELINSQLRTLNTNWPTGALLLSYAGYVLAPSLLVGVPMLVIGLVTGVAELVPFLITVGTVLTVVGGVGAVLLIAGLVSGFNATTEARAERERLIQRRIQLEDELRELRRSGTATGPGVSPASSLTVLAFGF